MPILVLAATIVIGALLATLIDGVQQAAAIRKATKLYLEKVTK